MTTFGILREPEHEKRVSLLPGEVQMLVRLGAAVKVESGAGARAFTPDALYSEAGATIVSRREILDASDVILHIQPPADEELKNLSPGKVLIGMMNPLYNRELVELLMQRGITSFSMELVPRTTRAQAMDVLSSMATVAGYRAVLDAAVRFPRFFPMFMTAAGTIKPARVLILGAGVAGLQALATARKLGAVVDVFDVRKAVKEEVLSLGGKFVEVEGAREDASAGGYAVEQTEEYLRRQAAKIHEHAVKSDVVICTAQIPGKPAPVLLLKDTVHQMQPGSVIIDIAAATGGNCELTKNGEVLEYNGVTIVGKSDYPSDMPLDASRMYGRNLLNFLKLVLGKEGVLNINFNDDIIAGTCLTFQGAVRNERVRSLHNLSSVNPNNL
ncbi:MAG: Re/Si-specific NAD(P)(+) transhydrogenase subunit alpha [Bacteroidales bacterium]|nr:Re/Si-specific NAD(P)(+) transhydrogenase subunit alpha [Bacteroidales bacterium]